jgi:hypothetical protein
VASSPKKTLTTFCQTLLTKWTTLTQCWISDPIARRLF